MEKVKKLSKHKKYIITTETHSLRLLSFSPKHLAVRRFQFFLKGKYSIIGFFIKKVLQKSLYFRFVKRNQNFQSGFRGYIRLLSRVSPDAKQERYASRKRTLTIRFSANNIFITLNRKVKKTMLNFSLGKLKVIGSKKNLAFISRDYFWKAFDRLKPYFKKKARIKVILISPIRYRRRIYYTLQKITRYKRVSFKYVLPNRICFNGCRPRKCKRKKRAGRYLRKK